MTERYRLAIFSKVPAPGRVKTRLQPLLSKSAAARLYLDLLRTNAWACAETRIRTDIWLPPGSRSRQLARLAWRLGGTTRVQRGENLGQRMQHALNSQIIGSNRPLILIGADCPFIDSRYLGQAQRALIENDVVLGPALDGGFVLIGARRPLPSAMFRGVAWSSEEVLHQTMERIGEAGFRLALLPTLRDIDRPADLDALDRNKLHRMRWLFGIE